MSETKGKLKLFTLLKPSRDVSPILAADIINRVIERWITCEHGIPISEIQDNELPIFKFLLEKNLLRLVGGNFIHSDTARGVWLLTQTLISNKQLKQFISDKIFERMSKEKQRRTILEMKRSTETSIKAIRWALSAPLDVDEILLLVKALEETEEKRKMIDGLWLQMRVKEQGR